MAKTTSFSLHRVGTCDKGPNKYLVDMDEEGVGHIHFLMEDDEPHKGRFIRQLSHEEGNEMVKS
jgi:hypothetical protein